MELNLFSFVFFMLFCKVKTKLQNSFLCIFIYFTAHSGLFGPVKAVDHLCNSQLP